MNDLARKELEEIRIKNNGFLRPQEVVEFARNEETALHRFFEWDDSEAAVKYRLLQAKSLIRVCVVVEANTSEQVRAYVSLSNERNAGGGYRAIAEVMSDEALLDRMLDDALNELASFKRKYESLKGASELGSVFTAIENVIHKSESQQLTA